MHQSARFLKVAKFQQQHCFNQLTDSPFLNYFPYAAAAHVKITVQNTPVICPVMTFTTSSKAKKSVFIWKVQYHMQLQTFTMLTEFSGGTQDIPPSNFILSPLIGASYLGCLTLRISLHLKLEGSNKFLFGDWASPLSQGLDDPATPPPPYLNVWIHHCKREWKADIISTDQSFFPLFKEG